MPGTSHRWTPVLASMQCKVGSSDDTNSRSPTVAGRDTRRKAGHEFPLERAFMLVNGEHFARSEVGKIHGAR